MNQSFHAGFFRRLAPVFILLTLALGCVLAVWVGSWPYNAFPAEKQIARNIELASYGSEHINSQLDYCIPRPGLPVCSADLLENYAPGTPCFVQKCGWGHVTNLSLYGGQLEELPADIAGLQGLAALNLHDNQLTALPPEIGRLINLTELDLSGNQLTQLPSEIGQLTHLTKLDLSGNRLTRLPPEISLLRSLTYLNLGKNTFQGPLPKYLTHLPLKQLIFSETNLCVPVDADFQQWISGVSTINFNASLHPDDVCSLAAEDQQAMQALFETPGRPADWDLEKIPCTWSRVSCDTAGHITGLDLSATRFAQIPPEIWQLSHLQNLNLTNSQQTGLPSALGRLHSLTHLYLGENQLTRLPLEIGQLPDLTELDLNTNRLTSLPPEIGRLQNLSSLNLRGNQLASLPPELGQLTNLTLLDVSANPLSGSLPSFLTQIPDVAFFFTNTNLCVPNDAGILDWLGRQSKGIYTQNQSGDWVHAPADPEASIRWYLEQQGCQ